MKDAKDAPAVLYPDTTGRNGIPVADALMGIYAAYYVGSHNRDAKDHLNAHFNLRALNRFNMADRLVAAFGQPDSPWIVLDHLSDSRRDGRPQAAPMHGAMPMHSAMPMHGAHFLALYHRASQRVMVAMPGLESDDNPGDTLMDIREMAFGGMRGQSKALYHYVRGLENRTFTDQDGQPLPVRGQPLIGAHSLGCTAAQMMALAGYETVLVEPRPLHQGLLRRIADNFARITGGAKPAAAEVLARLQDTTVNIRSAHANVWNSVILPWVRQHDAGLDLAYTHAEHRLRPADRGIGTFHRVEKAVPEISGYTEALGYEKPAQLSHAQGHKTLLADIIENNTKRPVSPKAGG